MLKRSLGIAVIVVGAWAGSVAAQDAKGTVDSASKALGVAALKTVQYSATGFDFALGQAPNPSSPWPQVRQQELHTQRSTSTRRPRQVDRVRAQAENPPRGGGQQPVVGDQTQSQTIVVAGDTPWAQQLEIWMMPHGFLRAAATRNSTAESKTVDGKRYTRRQLRRRQQGARSTATSTRRIRWQRVETWIDNAVPRRHAVRGDLLRLQGRRRRPVPDAHRPETGRLSHSSI